MEHSQRRTTKLVSNVPAPPRLSPPPLEPQDTEPDISIGYAHDSQPTPEELRFMGIKTRDFGYESKLPPVRPYMRPTILDMAAISTPRNSLRRSREDMDTPIYDESPPKKQKTTSKASSQKVAQYPVWHASHRQYPGGIPTTPQQQQASDTWVATPIVTPNGSLTWPTGDPQSQEDDDMLEPSGSQATEPPESQLEDFQLPDMAESQEESSQPLDSVIPESRSPTPRPGSAVLPSIPSLSSPNIPTLARVPSPRYKLRPRSAAPPPTSPVKQLPRPAKKKPASAKRDKDPRP